MSGGTLNVANGNATSVPVSGGTIAANALLSFSWNGSTRLFNTAAPIILGGIQFYPGPWAGTAPILYSNSAAPNGTLTGSLSGGNAFNVSAGSIANGYTIPSGIGGTVTGSLTAGSPRTRGILTGGSMAIAPFLLPIFSQLGTTIVGAVVSSLVFFWFYRCYSKHERPPALETAPATAQEPQREPSLVDQCIFMSVLEREGQI